jgi:hypothetical protein
MKLIPCQLLIQKSLDHLREKEGVSELSEQHNFIETIKGKSKKREISASNDPF